MVDRRMLRRAFLDYGLFVFLGTVYLLIATGFVFTPLSAFQHVHLLLPVSLVVVALYRRFRASYPTYNVSRELLLFLVAGTGVGTVLMAVGGVALHVHEGWLKEGRSPLGGTER